MRTSARLNEYPHFLRVGSNIAIIALFIAVENCGALYADL